VARDLILWTTDRDFGNTGKIPFALSVGARSAPQSKGA